MTDSKQLSLDDKRRLAKALLARKEAAPRAAATDAPIAVVGVGCRYPGGVVDPESFWRLLDGGVDAIRRIPRERWDADALYDADPDARGKTNTREGGFLDGIDQFDARFFGLSPREAQHIDPQHRLLLETSWEALERAGIPPHSLSGSATGVYVGLMWHDYDALRPPALEDLDGHVHIGSTASVASGRISYLLGLQGPSITVDTACSSSLVTLHLACQGLRAGECDMALAGGATLLFTPELHVEFAKLHGLAGDGRCKSFSASADGVGWGEGCGVLVLKRLDDAQRAGDPIWGVILGSAVNQDGRSNGLTAPNGPAQEAVLRRALARAGVAPWEVSYVEAHGTGTPLGDPIEARALASVYGEGRAPSQPLRIGSVKSNLGHTMAAAGVAGVIKVLLALRHGRLPASLHASALSPHVPWDAVPLSVVREAEAWRADGRPRVAAASSFGISGTNAHVVVTDPPAVAAMEGAVLPAYPIVLSGQTGSAAVAQARRLADHLDAHPELRVADVAYTLAHGRTHFAERLAIVASDTAALSRALRSLEAAPSGGALEPIAFLCTGQGAQYPGMGQGLYRAYPAFRDAIDACARALVGHLDPPLLDVLFGDAASRLDQTELTQPATFAVGVALDALWRSLGVEPRMYLGHSVGEYVAACAAGVFSLEDGARLVAARGRLMQKWCASGAMVALEAAEAEVLLHVAPRAERVSIAAINGPRQTVIAGDAGEVSEIVEKLGRAGVRGKRLAVSHAFHSPLMRPMLEPFATAAAAVRYAAPRVPVVSNVTGGLNGDLACADYWVRHVLAPVRFADGMRALHDAGARGFVELGAQPTLAGMGAASLPEGAKAVFLPSLRKGRDDVQVALGTAGVLWTRGVEIDFRASTAGGRRAELPTYPFERQRHFVDARGAAPRSAASTGHPLVGARVPAAGGQAIFESLLTHETLPWLRDHLVFERAVVPGAALVEWVQAAADACFGHGAYTVAELVFERALVVPDDEALRAQVVLTGEGGDAIAVAIYSQPPSGSDQWTRHTVGRIEPAGAARSVAQPRPEARGEALAPASIYAMFAEAGLRYMAAFRAVRKAWRDVDGAVIAEISLAEPTAGEVDRYGMHPALFDAALHALVLADGAALQGELFLPVAFRDVRFGVSGVAAARVRGIVVDRTPESIQTSLTVWDAAGAVVLEVGRLECKRVSAADLAPRGAGEDLLHVVEWKPLPSVAAERSAALGRSFLLFADGDLPPLGQALAERLRASGGQVTTRAQGEPPGPFDGVDGMVYFAPPGSDGAEVARASALHGLRLAQAVAAHGASGARLLWVTQRAQAVAPGEDVAPPLAACWGLGRVLLVEQPVWSIALVDVEHLDARDAADALLAELGARDDESQIALRGGRRYGARLKLAERAKAARTPELAGGAVLITGGLGGLGVVLARHLVDKHGARRLVLLGRGAPGADAEEAMLALRAAGARVDAVQVDVTDRAALARVIADHAPLSAVVHAAGVGDAALIAQQTPERFLRTIAAKVDGASHLHDLTRELPLQAFVMLSSIAAVLPTTGPSAYATGNAFLDGLAQHRRARGLPAQSLAFGPWAGAGMLRSLSPAEQQRLRTEGTPPMDPERALLALDAALARGEAQLVVVSLDLERRRRLHSGGAVPSLWRSLLRARREGARVDAAGARARIDEIAPEGRQDALDRLVCDVLARALSLPAGADVPRDRPFVELGVDSLIGVDLRNQLAGALGIDLSATLIWDHRTVRALSAHLASRLSTRASTRGPSAPAARAARPAARAVALHPEPPFPPIFAVGGVLGGSTYLKDLAAELGPLQPFYALPYPGLDDDADPLARVEDLAGHFLGLLTSLRPRGPYVILGHSFGGTVAFEMARRLSARGESVIELILLDTWTKATVAQKHMTKSMPSLDDMLAPFIAAGHAPEDLARYTRRFEGLWQANGEAFEHYEMARFDGDITLIAPEDDLFGLSHNVEDWRNFGVNVKVRRTSGNHATMVLPPNARRTAQIIRGILRGPARPAEIEAPRPAMKEAPREAAPAPGALPLAQRWMWLLHQLDPKSPRYNVFGGLRVSGALDADALDRAVDAVVGRHEALRTSFEVVDGEPRPVVHEGLLVSAARHDLSALNGASASALAAIKRELTETPFDLTRAPLVRVVHVTLGARQHLVLACLHHVVADGASFGIFVRDLLRCYEAEARGVAPALPPLPWRLADYARWERERLTGARLDDERAFWRRALDGLPRLQLPVDRETATRTGAGGVASFALDASLTRALADLARAEGCSLYMVLVAAFAALLGRYGGQDDFAVATVVGQRGRPEVRDLIGCFVNTVILRIDLSGAPTAREHLARVRARVVEAMDHQDLPFDEVARASAPAGGADAAALARVCFVFEKLGLPAAGDGPFAWERVSDTTSGDVAGTAKFDLSLSMEERDGGIHGSFVYARDVFEAATVERMAGHLTTLLEAMASDAGAPLAAMPLLTDEERRRVVVEWNDTARAREGAPRLHELFEMQAARTPDRVAVTHGPRSITYRELDVRATALAEHLASFGVGREACVGLCVERSIELVVAMLAILKAGGAYVPLDPAYPRERLRFMLDDSGARVVLTSAVGAAALGEAEGRRLVDVEHDDSGRERRAPSLDGASPADVAYLIYTSGSTGTPKAVAIEHRSVVELVRWALDTYPAEVLAGVLASTSVCFDLSVFELFVPLSAGGRVVLVADALELARLDAAADVRLVNTVPSAAAELLRQGGIPEGVRVLNLAGEPLAQALVEAIYAGTRVEQVYDLYGPSEDTTYSTCALRERGGAATIGRPISNTRVYLLDAMGQPVPVGVAGEICIAGAGLARGYWGRPALTAERFVADRFVPGARMYRTGDLGRYRTDGSIAFLGRIDGQVKLRGFRIELGEIEAALRAHEAVTDCAVVVRTDAPGDPRLCAYVVGREGRAPSPPELREHLARTLPSHMLPQHFVALPALPRTPNGKLDRRALPVPEAGRAGVDHAPPSPGTEETIAGVWREILRVDRVGRDDDFFELGGHSLLAVRAASLLGARLGREVTPIALFRRPVLRELAAHLGGGGGDADGARRAAAVQKQAIRQIGKLFQR
jgi:amino acid adenylation domain-containing protein